MTKNEILFLANNLMRQHIELNSWRFSFNKLKRCFGTCDYNIRTIFLSEYLCYKMTNEAIKDTLVHEIAHALTMGHGHDNVWRKKCIELGGNGNVKSSISKSFINGAILESKYTLKCPCCDNKVFVHRLPKKSRSCGKCDPIRYNEKYKMILIQNF
jgi:hypothetical protein